VIATVKGSSLTDDQWSVAPNPVGPSGKAAWPMATAGWGITSFTQHKAEALKLIEFLSNEEQSSKFAKENSLVPIQKSAAEDDFFKTGPWTAYVEMTSQPQTYVSVVEPRGVAWWTEWTQKEQADLQSVLLGQLSTADALKGWDQYWTEKWKA
ncbi:MAG: sugar ABC transporter substrate-binding protein, partial [Propionicimonas sp.]|nr:sugar ABC transporter substrate-binding protein [Propionicimonas sp.]